jgi:NADPH-dependent curcumin reductase CurA
VTDFEGLDSAGEAFVELLAGRTIGTTIVRVAEGSAAG